MIFRRHCQYIPYEPLIREVRIRLRKLRHKAEHFSKTDAHYKAVFGHAVVACIGYLARIGYEIVGHYVRQR